MRKMFLVVSIFGLAVVGNLTTVPPVLAELNLDKLSETNIARVKDLIKKLEPFIQEKQREKKHALLTFDELYAPLNDEEKSFLKEFQSLDAKELGVKIPFRGMASGKEDLVLIVGQKVKTRPEQSETIKTDSWELPPQYLPKNVFDAYTKMNAAMEKDIGKKLFVESGYRASAYQLYLFVYYLQNHKYSIRETVKFVALPGYSEHGAPKHQAIDFINADGINGEYNTKEFEELEEYKWLLKNAKRFGFQLSYPKDGPKGITYEPWHWRYDSAK